MGAGKGESVVDAGGGWGSLRTELTGALDTLVEQLTVLKVLDSTGAAWPGVTEAIEHAREKAHAAADA